MIVTRISGFCVRLVNCVCFVSVVSGDSVVNS